MRLWSDYAQCEKCGAAAGVRCRDMNDVPVNEACTGRRINRQRTLINAEKREARAKADVVSLKQKVRDLEAELRHHIKNTREQMARAEKAEEKLAKIAVTLGLKQHEE